MPVTKFRDVSEMPSALWTAPCGDAARRLAQVLSFWRRVVPRQRPRGVARFRTIQEANRSRQEWTGGA